MAKPRTFLHDLPPDAAQRWELVQAGLPVPASLLARGVGGRRSVESPPGPELPTPNLPPAVQTRPAFGRKTRGTPPLDSDPRRIHMEDAKFDCFAMCQAFWQWPVGNELLRHTQDWDEVTCKKCLKHREHASAEETEGDNVGTD